MEKNKISKIAIGHVLPYYCNRILPQVYDDSLSFQELIYQVLAKINEIIDVVDSYDDIYNELKEILDNFDQTVYDEVRKYIAEMYKNGDLADIIENIIKDEVTKLLSYPSKTTNLDFTRLFRKFYNVGENNYYVTNSNQKTYTQGCVHFKHNDIYMCAVALKCSNHTNYRYDNTAKIVIYNMHTAAQIGSVNLTVGHANSLAYDSNTGYLYIAWDYTNPNGTSTQQNSKNVSRILVDDIIAGNTSSFLTRSPAHSFEKSSTVTCYGGKLYIGNRNQYCEYDFGNNQVKNTYTLTGDDSLSNVTYIQDMSINDKYVALLSYLPSRIYLYDKETHKLIWAYNIPNKLNAGLYRVIEPEAITLDNAGNIYLFTGGHTAKKDFNAYDILQVFRQNLYFNYMAPRNTGAGDRRGRNVEIHYDHNNEKKNPNGDEDNPFNYPQEALMFIEDNEDIARASIVVHSSVGGVPWYVCSEKSIMVYPADDATDRIYIGGLAIEGSTNFSIRDCTIKGIGAVMEHSSEYFDLKKNVVACRNSMLNISNCKITIDPGSNGEYPRPSSVSGTSYGIQGKYMFMNYSGNDATTESEFESAYSGKEFMNFTDSTVNARGKASNNSNVFNPGKIQYQE